MTTGGLLVEVAARFLKPRPLAMLFATISIAALLVDTFEQDWFPGHRETAVLIWLLALICSTAVLASRSLLSWAALLIKPRSPLFPVAPTSLAVVALVSAIPGSDPTRYLHLVLWLASCYAPALAGISTNQWNWKKTALKLTLGACALNTLLVAPAFPLVVEVWILFLLVLLSTVRGVVATYGLMLIAGSAVTLLRGRADLDLTAVAACMVLLTLFSIIYAPSLIWIRSRLTKDRWRERTYVNRTRTGIGPQHFV